MQIAYFGKITLPKLRITLGKEYNCKRISPFSQNSPRTVTPLGAGNHRVPRPAFPGTLGKAIGMRHHP
jgi:hypothetical protein